MDQSIFNAVKSLITDQCLKANPDEPIGQVWLAKRAKTIVQAGLYARKENGTIILLPEPSGSAPIPAPTPSLVSEHHAPKKRLSLEETRLRNRTIKTLIEIGEKRLAKASLDVSPIGETFLGILLDAQEELFNELQAAFAASKGVEFLEDLETLEDPETGLVPLMKRHGIVPGRWTLEFHKEVTVKQPPAQVPVPTPVPAEDAGPSVTVTEGDNGLPTINVELVQPSTNFVVNPDGSIGEQIVAATEAVTVDNAFSLMQRANARRNQRRNHQRNAG